MPAGPHRSPADRSVRATCGLVALVAVALAAAFVVARAEVAAHGELDRFVVAGDQFTDPATVEPRIHVFEGPGYDGQFYFRQTTAPFDLDMGAVNGVHLDQQSRSARIGYPLAARTAALLRPSAAPTGMVVVNVLAIGAIALVGAAMAIRGGRSPWTGLLLASSSGLVMAVSRDLTEAVMVAAIVAGIALVASERWAWAGLAWAIAVATHEQALALVGAYALARLAAMAVRRSRPGLHDLPWALPAIAFGAIQGAIRAATGTFPALSSGSSNVGAPFVGLASEGWGWISGDLAKQEVMVLPELALVVAIVVVAIRGRATLPDPQRWLLWAIAATGAYAVVLTRYVWAGPAELRSIVTLPTASWAAMLANPRPIPRWLIAASVLVLVGVAALRVVAV